MCRYEGKLRSKPNAFTISCTVFCNLFFFQFVITYKNGSYFHCCRHITHVILHNISKTLISMQIQCQNDALKALNHETSIHHKQKTLTFNSTISAKLTASQFH
eukprot:352194_1